MRYAGTPDEIAFELRLRALALRTNCRTAMNDTLDEAKKIAVAYSSFRKTDYGEGTYAYRASQGAPYSRRAPHPPIPEGFIHIQSGDFVRKFTVKRTSYKGGKLTGQLLNKSEHWKLLKRGTGKMIARPLSKMVIVAIKARHLVNLRLAVNRSINP